MVKNKFKAEFGGRNRTFWLGLGFFRIFTQRTKLTIGQLQDAMKQNYFQVMPELIYSSLLYGFQREGAEPDFTIYNVMEWIDEDGGMHSQFVQDFMNKLVESMAEPDTPKLKENQKQGVKKKRVAST